MRSHSTPLSPILILVTIFLTLSLSFAEVQSAEVLIEVNNTSTESDDYLCWSPIIARARLVATTRSSKEVIIINRSLDGGGAVQFGQFTGAPPTRETFDPQDTLVLTLPGDGSWQNFWVSGSRASDGAKDALVVATDSSMSDELGTISIMVRVRKDANKLSPTEISQFTSALATLNGTINGGQPGFEYFKRAIAHMQSFSFGIHGAPDGFPLFLAWHRALLLGLERDLQKIDPRVAIPYWRFDRASTQIFTPEFMGITTGISSPGGFLVEFENANPLRNWRMPNGGPLVRGTNATSGASVTPLSTLFGRTGNDRYDSPGPRGINGDIELSHHNNAHNVAGGWLMSGSSPRDPLFYLLHNNVDRAWAEWQARFDRFDPSDDKSYSLQGTYPGPSDPNRFRKGSYAMDSMWPWSRDMGTGTPDPGDDWPSTVYDFPSGPKGAGPIIPPTPASMVDYMNVTGIGATHLSCYDHIDYFGNVN